MWGTPSSSVASTRSRPEIEQALLVVGERLVLAPVDDLHAGAVGNVDGTALFESAP